MNDQPSPPASIAEISEQMQLLFDALQFQRGTRADNVAASYVKALSGCTAEAIKAGVVKVLRGEVESINPRFVPTPPELARVIRTAVVQRRVPEERRLSAPPRPTVDGARARMRLKMPMYQAAEHNPVRIDQLAKANAEGLQAMILLASRWVVTIPAELYDVPIEEGERLWRQARSRAWTEIEARPPPFLRHQRRFTEVMAE